jgi:hypothetical protein
MRQRSMHFLQFPFRRGARLIWSLMRRAMSGEALMWMEQCRLRSIATPMPSTVAGGGLTGDTL